MQPEFTVVIPSHNRAELLRDCLLGLGEQSATARFEVVVVLDGCTDDSAELVRGLDLPFRLTVIEQPQAGPAGARNRGLAEASAPFALFIDDDISLVPGAILAHCEAQRLSGGAVVIGPIETVATHRGLPARSVAFWRARQRRHEAGGLLTFLDCFTGNMSVPLAALRGVGGFNESLRRSEDIELAYRLTTGGLAIHYAGEAGAKQLYTKNTRECLEDAEGFGRASITLWKLHPGMRKYLYFGGITPGAGVQSLLLPCFAGVPVPAAFFSAPGAIPAPVPGTRWFGDKAQAYMRARGARRKAGPDFWAQLSAKLQILRYNVAAFSESADFETFRTHMAWLGSFRGRATTLRAYLEALERGNPSLQGAIVVTLDAEEPDALGPWISVLRDAGVPATVFLGAGAGASSRVRELEGAGFEVGVLQASGAASPEALQSALREARDELHAAVGQRPSSVAFAANPVPPGWSAAAARAGFALACAGSTGSTGWRTDPYNVPRTPVEPGHSLRRFKLLVRLGAPPPGARFL